MRVPLADIDGVAVGYRPRHAPYADAAAGTANILDDDGLPERGCHPGRQNATRHVGRAARRKRHDERDGARRVSLRLGEARSGTKGGNTCCQLNKSSAA
jgi:hypothetical protein